VEVHREQHEWRSWCTTQDELLALVTRGKELISEAGGAPRVSGTVHFEGREVRVGLSEFAEMVKRKDLADMIAATFFVGTAEDGVQACMSFSSAEPGANLSVYGSNGIAVGGVSKGLRKELDKGKRRTSSSSVGFMALIIAGLTLLPFGFVTLVLLSLTAGLVIFGISALLLVWAAVVGILLPELVPPLELLPDKESETKAARWARQVRRAGVFLLGAFASAVIFILVDKVL